MMDPLKEVLRVMHGGPLEGSFLRVLHGGPFEGSFLCMVGPLREVYFRVMHGGHINFKCIY